MDKTKESLRRGVVYALLVIGCLIYAALPQSEKELALERAKAATHSAFQWAAGHIGGHPK